MNEQTEQLKRACNIEEQFDRIFSPKKHFVKLRSTGSNRYKDVFLVLRSDTLPGGEFEEKSFKVCLLNLLRLLPFLEKYPKQDPKQTPDYDLLFLEWNTFK